jgi:hypothetical protein
MKDNLKKLCKLKPPKTFIKKLVIFDIRENYSLLRPSWLAETPRTTTLTFSSSTPWNATGYYHYPRYPESYRGLTEFSFSHLHLNQIIKTKSNDFYTTDKTLILRK